MTDETKREILKACYYGFTHDVIAANCGISEDEVRDVIEKGVDILEELEAREYGN